MDAPINRNVLIQAFAESLERPIASVTYAYLETEETIKQEIEKWNNTIDENIKKDPTGWYPNKIIWDPKNYTKVDKDLYVVLYNRAITPYTITFKDFVRKFLEIKDDKHIPLGVISKEYPLDRLVRLKDALEFGRYDSWLDDTKETQPEK